MKPLVRGALGPALLVAVLQFVIEMVLPITAAGKPFQEQITVALGMVGLSQMTLLIGAALYAGALRRRSGASLAACTVGGAIVGLLANLASQVAKSVLLCLVAVVFMDGALVAVLVVKPAGLFGRPIVKRV